MKPLKKIIKEALDKKIAIGHFNIASLEMLKAISRAAVKLNSPVIIGVSEGEREYLGDHHVRDLIESYRREHNIPIYLNADHTHSLEKCEQAARLGFDAILFDAGKLPLEENIKETKKAVEIVKSINPDILVEGELGYIGSSSMIRKDIPAGAAINPGDLTKPEDAARFVKETGVDLLGPAVGNIHGMFADAPEPALDIPIIKAIADIVKIPLVLHGGSGNTDDDFRAAIKAGVSIIHINTEIRLAWRKSLDKVLKDNPDEIAPYKIYPQVIAVMQAKIEEKIKVFGAAGKS
ncbi:MAG: class II fructose-bisphosphate aldolase [Candidatus Brennerbacteria bacterium]|nr:class II fructose-bisphosphate aldolase [Candidatus Brennerbacteria bacterium]